MAAHRPPCRIEPCGRCAPAGQGESESGHEPEESSPQGCRNAAWGWICISTPDWAGEGNMRAIHCHRRSTRKVAPRFPLRQAATFTRRWLLIAPEIETLRNAASSERLTPEAAKDHRDSEPLKPTVPSIGATSGRFPGGLRCHLERIGPAAVMFDGLINPGHDVDGFPQSGHDLLVVCEILIG